MDKDLEITVSLDKLQVEHQDILSEVDEHIKYAIEAKDVELAFMFCKDRLIKIKNEGLALAKALWMINYNWNVFKLGDEFLPTANDYLGSYLHPHTIERYVKVWNMLTSYVPEELKEELKGKNIKYLIPIANAVASGYEVDNETWEKLADAPMSEIPEIVREDITKKPARKNNLTLKIDENGSIWAYTISGRYFIGSLEVKIEEEHVQKAVNRIITNSGILRG